MSWQPLNRHLHQLDVCPASFAAVGILAALATSGAYWLLVACLTARRATRAQGLQFHPLDPIATPGVQALSGLFWLASVAALFVAALLVAPVSVASLISGGEPLLGSVTVISATGGLLVAAVVLTMPQYWLSKSAREEKARLERMCLDQLSSDPISEEAPRLLVLRSSPDSTTNMAGIFLSIGIIVLPLLLERVVSWLSGGNPGSG